MPDRDAIDERLRAVERALTDDDRAPADLAETAAVEDRVDDLARRTTDVEERVAELDAAVQALRGYVGNVRAVNDDVERRADAALAKVESLAREGSPTGAGAPASDSPTAGGRDGPRRAVPAVTDPDGPERDERASSRADRGSTDGADDGPGLLDRLGEVL